MSTRLWFTSLLVVILASPCLFAQDLQLTLDRPHPRLLLTQRRVRLLQRERERDSMRWQQFRLLMERDAEFPEPGFAQAIYYVATQDKEHARRAIEWALGEADDLRQLALVFDWCQAELTPAESTALARKLAQALDRNREQWDVPSARDRLLAAIAVAGHVPGVAETSFREIVQTWWRGRIVPEFEHGGWPIRRRDVYPLLEILHAIRDNTRIDLRLDYRPYFANYPVYALLTYYPAIYPAGANDYRIPLIEDGSEPDLTDAALARAADLAMVAYAPNDQPVQYLQGFAMFDQFMMRGTFGIPYEFLWANPYQPGLSYYNTPLLFHDPVSGVLAVRTSWDGDAQWLYHAPGRLQTFADGRIINLTWADAPDQLVTEDAVVLPVKGEKRFQVHEPEGAKTRTYYLLGLTPHAHYDFEVDDEGLAEYTADTGGIVVMKFPPGRTAGVRFHERPQQTARVR